MRFTFLTLLLLSLRILSAQEISKMSLSSEAMIRVNFTERATQEIERSKYHQSGIKAPNPEHKHTETPIGTVLDMDEVRNENRSHVLDEISPLPDTTFNALDDPGNTIPPDVNGAAGPDHIMTTLNTDIRVQDRNGNVMFTTVLDWFWQGLPGEGGVFDPKIVYDPYNDRWIMTNPRGNTPSTSRLYVGVSETGDPTGDWFLYSFKSDPANIVWFDYPSMGFNNKWIAISGNMFGNDFYTTMWTFDKMAMYAGAEEVSVNRFTTNMGFTIVPAFTYDDTEPNLYCISTATGNSGGSGFISLFKISGSVANPDFSFVGSIGTPNPWEGWMGEFLPQLGTPVRINSVDHRMETVVFRNNKLWATHHIFLPANNPQRCSVQWWNLDTDGNILQRGRVDDPTNELSFAFPSLAVNENEDIMIGHSVFSLNQYAASGYSFKRNTDPDNSIRAYYQYKDGEAPYVKTFGSGRNRWGDYSATMVDPVNDIDFWVIQEYADQPDNTWGTWWAFVPVPFSPQADFVSDEFIIPVGDTVNFFDQSLGIPDSWAWTFEGASPASSNNQNPSNIVYEQEGIYDVGLSTSNIYGDDEILKPGFIEVSSSILPEIHFKVSKTVICTNEAIYFIDSTIYSPNEWEWQFTPSTVEFLEGTDEFSKNPVVSFSEPGSYSVTVEVSNLNGSSSTTEFDLITVGGYNMPFYESFETGSLRTQYWDIENPDDNATWDITSAAGNPPGNQAVWLDFPNYTAVNKRDRLISPPINLNNIQSAVLSFKHAYAARYADYSDSLIVYISTDCGFSWERLLTLGEDGNGSFATHPMVEDGSFMPQSAADWCTQSNFGPSCFNVDLSNYIGLFNVKIAFETVSFYGNPLFVDDIAIEQFLNVEETTNARLEISPNPNNGIFTISLQETSNSGLVEVYNLSGQQVLSKPADQNIIHLDLSNQPKGLYLIKFQGQAELTTEKVIVQ